MALKKPGVFMLLASVLITACAKEPAVPVEKLFINGVVYTANQTQQVVTSIGITKDRLIYVGDAQGTEAVISSDTEIIDINVKLIILWLHDMYIHLPAIVETDNCDLADQPFSLTDMIPRL